MYVLPYLQLVHTSNEQRLNINNILSQYDLFKNSIVLLLRVVLLLWTIVENLEELMVTLEYRYIDINLGCEFVFVSKKGAKGKQLFR